MKRYICTVCSRVYDPFEGDPANGVEPATSFLDLPFEWTCPRCGAGRRRFEREEPCPRKEPRRHKEPRRRKEPRARS